MEEAINSVNTNLNGESSYSYFTIIINIISILLYMECFRDNEELRLCTSPYCQLADTNSFNEKVRKTGYFCKNKNVECETVSMSRKKVDHLVENSKKKNMLLRTVYSTSNNVLQRRVFTSFFQPYN